MADHTFETKARHTGIELGARLFLVGGTLMALLFVAVVACMMAEDHPIAGGVVGMSCVAGGALWCRFIRPLRTLPKIVCPSCGGKARIEGSLGSHDLVCSQCGRRADTTLRTDL
ncbi:MAG: hypothetical protein JNN07_24140 [Verrucomicrobiales bacterium]|nr:hypothetical protein [Verrucomicrobiales bacterium]